MQKVVTGHQKKKDVKNWSDNENSAMGCDKRTNANEKKNYVRKSRKKMLNVEQFMNEREV